MFYIWLFVLVASNGFQQAVSVHESDTDELLSVLVLVLASVAVGWLIGSVIGLLIELWLTDQF